ncbi:MAG: elongation factor P [Candidatus Buchananbacteria bacterium]|jgi:elongation factor P
MAILSTLNDIKKSINVLYNGEPYVVMSANFVKMQMRKPVMQTKLKNLLNGKTVETTFHQGDRVEVADMARKKVDYLYNDGDKYYFMSQNDFEQFEINKDTLGDSSGYLRDGDKVDALYFNDNPVSISVQPKVELKVVSSPEGVRGDSAQGRVTKVAEMETGLKINVPLFVKEGDVIRINTETGEYVERVTQ